MKMLALTVAFFAVSMLPAIARADATQPSLQLGPPAPASHPASGSTRPYSLGDPATLPTSEPASTQNASGIAIPDQPRTEGGLVEYLAARFSPLEPIYFIYGTDAPNIKFQFSLKYQLFSPEGSLAHAWKGVSGFYIGYSQTSFWDLQSDSSPFFDSSYRPQVLYLYQQEHPTWLTGMSHFDFQTGVQHESNGQAGADSRSLNIVYATPVFTFGDPGTGNSKGLFLAIAPSGWFYFGSLSDNPDIKNYMGNFSLKVVTGWRGGFQLSAIGTMGDDWQNFSIEINGSYPLRNLLGKNLDLYLYGQLFTGYGESLLDYNESGSSFRVGLAMVR